MSEDYTLEIIETERKKTGAVDGPEHTLICADCGTKLIHLKVIYPDAPVSWLVCADCSCGECSEYLEIKGEFRHSVCEGVAITDIHISDNNIVYDIKKLGD